jgi:hypothetical protein
MPSDPAQRDCAQGRCALAKTFKLSLSGPILDQVHGLAANEGVEIVELIRRILWLWFMAGPKEPAPSGTEVRDDGLTLALDGCLRTYKRSLDVYLRIREELLDLRVVAGHGRKVVFILDALEVVGDAVSCVPGLVEELKSGRRVVAQLRRQAAEHGFLVRYDLESSIPEPQNDP